MNVFNENVFREGLQSWLNTRFALIPEKALHYFSKGGWEGWWQVELAMWFASFDYDVEREMHVYKNNPKLSADLVFNSHIDTATNYVVEIKCQSITQTMNSFIEQIQCDIEKIKKTDFGYKIILVSFIDENVVPTFQENNFKLLYDRNKNLGVGWLLLSC